MQVDEGPILEHRTATIFTSTIDRIPLGIRFFEPHKEGMFGVTTVPLSPRRVVVFLIPLLCGLAKRFTTGRLHAKNLVLHCGKEIRYTLDGEVYSSLSQELSILLGPKLKIAVL